MGNPEYLNRMKETDLPFEGQLTDEEKHYLEVLRLNNKSTAEQVRRVAISTRVRGVDPDKEPIRALFWALHETNDCINAWEFLKFIAFDHTFEAIETQRFADLRHIQ